jgi:hypothetical protein
MPDRSGEGRRNFESMQRRRQEGLRRREAGRQSIEACMKSHLSEISDPCKDAVSQATVGKS